MTSRLTRRTLLRGLAAGTLLPWWSGVGHAAAAASGSLFRHGVASGDPDADSVVIWTRLTPGTDAAATASTRVRWEVAEDTAFSRILRTGAVPTDADRDHTVKALVPGLAPGRTYYYRFEHAGVRSMVGRTRTLPTGHVESLCMAVVSCSNWPFGHFNGYDAIARDPDVDLVLHLGDYIYEYGADGWGGATGERIGRPHAPTHEILDLADYRTRHAQYKTDAASMLMLASHPLIAIWDDHESANNPWTGGAQNHTPATEGDWSTRRASSLQAYYEWMPIRAAARPDERMDYWRHFRFGDLASMVSLETRHTGRARQVDYTEHLTPESTVAEVEAFRRDVLGAPGRTMISPPQETFLRDALEDARAAGRPWRILANQVPMARVQVPPLDADAARAADGEDPFAAVRADEQHPAHAQLTGLTALGHFDLPIYTDTWDGYPWARERLYALCHGAGVDDLLVLTGDSHAFWLNDLRDASGRSVGVELGTTGISSPGDFADFGPELGARIDRLLGEHNPEVVWTDNVPRGWLKVRLDHEAAQAHYMAVSNVETTDYRSTVLKSVTVQRTGGTLRIA